jgi:hypothetical protein
MFLILSLVHTPLPEADYHNIRHHDGPGEVCEHHDHLLRWHPKAGSAEDVAVLHWHWFLPAAERSDVGTENGGKAIHAHVVDWTLSTWDDGPQLLPDSQSRFHRILATSFATLDPAALPADLNAAACTTRSRPAHGFGATFAPGVSRASLLQRWDC